MKFLDAKPAHIVHKDAMDVARHHVREFLLFVGVNRLHAFRDQALGFLHCGMTHRFLLSGEAAISVSHNSKVVLPVLFVVAVPQTCAALDFLLHVC
jgi:hypothetical protein